MNERTPAGQEAEKDARWRETPLDYWSIYVDPAALSGQQWIDNPRDPGAQREENQETREDIERRLQRGELFMHPVRDVTYRNE